MLSEGEIAKTIQYISDRRCISGGYCFYQLDEPNLSDTWYALGCLSAFDRIEPDPQTIRYLDKPYPPGRGSLELFRTWYQYWSYQYIAGAVPATLKQRISDLTPPTGKTSGTIESSSALEQIYYFTILMIESGIGISNSLREELKESVFQWQHPDGGFGRTHSTLVETWHATSILTALDASFEKKSVASFLNTCVDPDSGFINVPATHPGFLEHLDAGVSLASLLNIPIPNPGICLQFIAKCRTQTGGYTRSQFGGNPTLEYTWLAIRTLTQLNGREIWS